MSRSFLEVLGKFPVNGVHLLWSAYEEVWWFEVFNADMHSCPRILAVTHLLWSQLPLFYQIETTAQETNSLFSAGFEAQLFEQTRQFTKDAFFPLFEFA